MIVSRILPGNDLKISLEHIMENNRFKSGVIVSIVGSLNETRLRMSNGDKKIYKGFFEIVSSEGTISQDGVHVHLAISDKNGFVYGGHLLEGCIIHTTAEICVLKSKIKFRRIMDHNTGYKELYLE